MKVHEVKALLDTYPDDMEVLIARDEEGNGFNSLEGYGQLVADKGEYEWEVCNPDELTSDPNDEDYDKVYFENPQNVIVLWP